ncbi:MAG: antibiotic ABC transporter permease, partial [Dialister sp.]|nr:antibiotic ABC transporter permease [Dialister sp.]
MMSTFQLFLQQLAVICKKEILSIWQDPATRRIVVIPCILMGFLFGYAANYNLENAPYVVLDQSRSGASADLLSRFDRTSLFHRVATVSNANEIAPYIEQEKA